MLTIAWKEIQKNTLVIGAFIVFTILMVLVYNDYLPGLFVEQREMLATSYSLMLGVFVNMIIFGGLMANEKEENQSNGYEFMRTLPIEPRQIVMGKFISTLVSALIAIVTVVIVTAIFGTKLESKLLPNAYTIFNTGIGLVLVGVLYLFAFRISYSRFVPVIILTYVGTMMLPQVGHLLLLIAGAETTVEQLFTGLTLGLSTAIFGFCLVLYVGLAFWAVRIKTVTPAPQ